MKVTIKEPCDADWNKMKIGMISRHCELCNKSVMDFTKMTREEILLYLFNNNKKSTCARMYGGQIDFHHQELEAIIEGTRRQQGNKAFLVLSFATLALMSCETETGVTPTVIQELGEIELVHPVDSVSEKDSSQVEEKVVPKTDSSEVEKKAKSYTPKRGEVAILTGDVEAFPGLIEVPAHLENHSMGAVIPGEELMGDTLLTEVEQVFSIAEVMPEFPGGTDSLLSYLSSHIQYPKKAQRMGMEGRVYVQFIVEKDGTITEPIVLKGVDESLDKEALRVVKSMPNWIPGKNRGEEVRTKFVIPVKYQLK